MEHLALICPAQGMEYPDYLLGDPFYPEPVGSAPPKFSQETETLTFKRRAGTPLALLCLAQASPLPTFRSGLKPSTG